MARNPQAAFENMLRTNPQIQQAVEYINQCGGDPQRAFQNLLKQQGLDPGTSPNDILNKLK